MLTSWTNKDGSMLRLVGASNYGEKSFSERTTIKRIESERLIDKATEQI